MANKAKLNELVALITARVEAAPARPELRLVLPPGAGPQRMCAVLREAHVKRITHLKRFFGLQWLIDQATFNAGTIDSLGDSELIALLSDMERARECREDGISFEDAGLLRRCAASGNSHIKDTWESC